MAKDTESPRHRANVIREKQKVYHKYKIGYCLLAVLLIIGFTVSHSALRAETETYELNNGMTVILKENHSSPMIASVIFVKSGSKYESRFENGITHFLEHFLFDGTVNQSREELDLSIRNLGGYLNAFTREDMTAYLVLVPKQFIDYGMTVQADMLFCSTIPESELAKERKVVIEEINRSADSPGSAASAFFTEKAFSGTDYARPVLGYKPFIENISREAIVAYWKKYYTPDRMVMLTIGDFDSESIKATIASVFEQFTDSSGPDAEEAQCCRLTGQNVYDTVANVQSTYIDISIDAPHLSDSSYIPFSLLTEYLGLDEISPLKVALTGGAEPLATEVSVSLDAKKEFSRLNISIISNHADKANEIVTLVTGQLSNMAAHQADPKALQGIKTSIKTNDIYMAEKLHYYAFIIAPMMMSAGWDFIQAYPEMLDQVTWEQARATAGQWLTEPNYVATIVRPVGESGSEPYRPVEMTADEVVAYFDTATFAQYNLDSGKVLNLPEVSKIDFELVDRAEYRREELANGLTLIVKSSPDSKVFAVNVLGRNRTASEPVNQAGITDMVNRLLEKGTASRSATELSQDLNSIGANLTLYDNPWIPYDDRYTTRQFSFIKFETIDEYAVRGFDLLVDMLTAPAFDSTEVEKVRGAMMGVLGRDGTSPANVARDLFYETLFRGKSYANPIMGSNRTIASTTIENLKQHHARMYSPSNMILSIATSHPIDTVVGWVTDRLGNLPAASEPIPAGKAPEPLTKTRSAHKELDKEQIGIYLGGTLPGANSPDAATLDVATSILSSRLYLNLREKQGLAYSTGAGSTFDPDFGWYYLMIGTGIDNYQTALDGLILQIDKLRLDGPTQEEVDRARNALWGRLMSAKLSRINQAYYLGVDDYLGRQPGYDKIFLDQLQKIEVKDVQRVAAQYFRTDKYVLATAGKMETETGPEEEE